MVGGWQEAAELIRRRPLQTLWWHMAQAHWHPTEAQHALVAAMRSLGTTDGHAICNSFVSLSGPQLQVVPPGTAPLGAARGASRVGSLGEPGTASGGGAAGGGLDGGDWGP